MIAAYYAYRFCVFVAFVVARTFDSLLGLRPNKTDILSRRTRRRILRALRAEARARSGAVGVRGLRKDARAADAKTRLRNNLTLAERHLAADGGDVNLLREKTALLETHQWKTNMSPRHRQRRSSTSVS